MVEASPERKQHFTRLCTITGVGPVVGTALVNTLERVPLKSADAFVAFTGLDPRPDDSGQHRGKRRLSKRGPAELRRLLYLAAMSAVKTKTWRPLYEHYRAKGLSSTATLVILARRIARTAWSMYTYKTEFDPARLTNRLDINHRILRRRVESIDLDLSMSGEDARTAVGLVQSNAGTRPVAAGRFSPKRTRIKRIRLNGDRREQRKSREQPGTLDH